MFAEHVPSGGIHVDVGGHDLIHEPVGKIGIGKNTLAVVGDGSQEIPRGLLDQSPGSCRDNGLSRRHPRDEQQRGQSNP